ncbi:MAG: AraC family transcriptional regulator [Segniliparus sp.]|uniref:AraC family transcriptional regulator n=1 Tax=Segniliparus sp. TaxID=2804064 RepID=UPI003F416FB2
MGNSRLEQATIPGNMIVGLLDLGEKHRAATERWFDGTGLSPRGMREGSQLLSYRQARSIVRHALRALPAGPWGLAVGSRDVHEVWGLLGFALRSCRTIGDTLAVGLRHHQTTGTLTDYASESSPDEIAIRVDMRQRDPELEPFLVEESLASVVTLMRSSFSPAFAPTRVEFAYPPPPYVEDYRKFFKCPLRFNAAVNRGYLAQSLMSSPIETSNAMQLALALRALGEDGQRPDPVPDTLAVVREQLRQSLPGAVTMAEIAKRLHTTERTLHRHLAAGGYRFSELRDEVRKERALSLLARTSNPVKAIAAEVGYRDDREFRRAFHRWTGGSPNDFRGGRQPSAERRAPDSPRQPARFG